MFPASPSGALFQQRPAMYAGDIIVHQYMTNIGALSVLLLSQSDGTAPTWPERGQAQD